MKSAGEPYAGNLPVGFDEGLMGNAISLLYQMVQSMVREWVDALI